MVACCKRDVCYEEEAAVVFRMVKFKVKKSSCVFNRCVKVLSKFKLQILERGSSGFKSRDRNKININLQYTSLSW